MVACCVTSRWCDAVQRALGVLRDLENLLTDIDGVTTTAETGPSVSDAAVAAAAAPAKSAGRGRKKSAPAPAPAPVAAPAAAPAALSPMLMTRLLDLNKSVARRASLQHRAHVLCVCSQFYTLIPHACGTSQPPLLRSRAELQKKREMVEALIDIEIATNLLKESGDKTSSTVLHNLDIKYNSLHSDMQVLAPASDEFKWISQYLVNTHGPTHNAYKLAMHQVFKVCRQGEDDRFTKMHNRRLLWHGSRTTNFVGILSQGLRIAPPEAPVTGYMFGKGVYFADVVRAAAVAR